MKASLLKFVDAAVGGPLCRLLGWLALSDGKGSASADIQPDALKNILVIRPGGIGDMVLLLPVLALLRLKFPRTAITIVCERRNSEVLEFIGMQTSALVYDTNPFSFLFRLRAKRYDLVIDTEQFHHFSAIFGFLSRAPVRIGFKINPRRNPLYTHLINYALDGHETAQFMRLLVPLGIRPAEHQLEGLISDFNAVLPDPVRSQLEELQGSRRIIAVHPGGSSIYKRWEPRNYVDAMIRLNQAGSFLFVLLGGAGDRQAAMDIAGEAQRNGCAVVSVAGGMRILHTACLIRKAALLIGPDSGLIHLGVVMGIPTLSLFGPSDWLKWGFEDNRHVVARTNVPCSPCFIFGYHKPCRSAECMKSISVNEIASAAERLLGIERITSRT